MSACVALTSSASPDVALPLRQAVVEARGVAAAFGQRIIVRAVDLAVGAGEKVALLGCNGSGKTTLLRVLAGLEPPFAGEVRWRGRALPRGGERTRVVGVVFQAEAPPQFTVRELVTLGLALDRPPSRTDLARVASILEQEDLAHLAHRRCQTLSGGEWQRCAMARALVARPSLILLDEPTNHLDPRRRAALHERLLRFREESVLLATHDLELAALCDRVVLLGEGRVVASGPTSDVMTSENLSRLFAVSVRCIDDPAGGRVFRLPSSLAERP